MSMTGSSATTSPRCRTRRRLPAVLAAALLCMLPWAAGAAEPTLTTVRIADAGQDVDAQAFYAQELGIFKKYGIAPEFTLLRKGGGAAAVAAVAGGAVDVGEGDIVSVANARSRGIPVTLLAPSGIFRATAPTTVLIVAAGSPIKTAKDFEGKSIALISPEGPSRISIETWLEANGAIPERVSFLEVPPVTMAAAVDRGTVAGALINEPSLTAAGACCRVLANPFASVAERWQLNAWYATADWVAKNPDLARRVALALREAAQWANQPANRAQSGAILAKYTPFSLDLLPRMTRASYGEAFDPKLMQPILDAALKHHALSGPVQAATMIAPGMP